MLVAHRSGIPNFSDQHGFDWSATSIDIMSLVLDQPADFVPNTDYRYSNTNYVLLQQIMTSVLGYDYTHYIETDILKPLGLNNTYFSIHQIDSDRLMSGYHVGLENDWKSLVQGYVATAQDVGQFIRTLNTNTVFTPEEQAIYASFYEYIF